MKKECTTTNFVNEKNDLPKFGLRDKIGYAFGDLGCNLSFALISAYMLDFYKQYIGITTATWAIIIILIKIWDGINDPIMGGIMDSVRIGKSGSKFKPWMKIGMVGLIVSGALVFLPIPNAAYWVKVMVCICSYLLWDIFYTLLNVPYGALNCAISSDPVERTQLSTWRSIGAGLGGVICMIILPMIVYDKDENLIGGRFVWIGLIMGVMAFFAYFACLKMTTERVITAVDEEKTNKVKYNFFQTLKDFMKNRPLIAMCLASFALIVFFLSNVNTTKWLFQVYFGETSKILPIANVVAYLPLVLFIPFVSKITKRFGKKLSAGVPLFTSVVACVVMMSVKFPQSMGGAIGYVLCLMLVQLGGGIFQLICWAMITDCVDYQQIKSGRREEGSVYAMYSFFRKVSQGVALVLPLVCMEAVGFIANAKPITNQSPGVPQKMIVMSGGLMLIGAVIMLISLLLIYNIGKKEVEEQGRILGRSEDENICEPILNLED